MLGRDVDVVSKQTSPLLQLFRPQMHVVNEDVRMAGRELVKAVLARIAGEDPRTLQSLSVPDRVVAPEQQAALAGA